MIVIDRSPWRDMSRPLSFFARIRGIWRFGFSWARDLQAQDTLLAGLERGLGNAFTVVRNVTLPGLDIPIPLVLVGPPGIFTIYVSSLKGIYQAKNDTWSVLEGRSDQYTLARPNLVRRVGILSRAVQNYLAIQGRYVESGDAVLFFAQPGVHVEAVHSAAHIVQFDGIDRFTASLAQTPNKLDAADVDWISSTLARARSRKPEATSPLDRRKPHVNLVGIGNFRMRPWQWFILALLILITIGAVIGLVFIAAQNFIF